MRRSVQEASPEKRSELLETFLREQVAGIARLAPEKLSPELPLARFGFDSLMTLELRNRVANTLGVKLSGKDLLEYPTIEALVSLAAHKMAPSATPAEDTTAKKEDAPPLPFPRGRADVRTPNDLLGEVRLDESIQASNLVPTTTADDVFLTGATGFMGAYLLHEMLTRTTARVHCLVRAASEVQGRDRLEENLKKYELWDERWASRIVPVVGKLDAPRLGLSESEFEALAKRVDAIVHNGAKVNWSLAYDAVKGPNVLGTQEVLRLAATATLKPIHHISTLGSYYCVLQPGREFVEDDDLPLDTRLPTGYLQSKWVSEMLVIEARKRGLRASIYRVAQVGGDANTSSLNDNDNFVMLIRACLAMSVPTNVDIFVQLAPVDFICSGIVHIAFKAKTDEYIHNLLNYNKIHWTEFWKQIAEMTTVELNYCSYDEFRAATENFEDTWRLMQTFDTYPRGSNGELCAPSLGCPKTRAILEKGGVSCPPLEGDLLRKYLTWWGG